MDDQSHAQTMLYKDVWLMGGARTPFADFNGTLRDVSATDLGIKAAREALQATKTAPDRIDAVVAASVAQTSFDAFFLARHIGLYAGVPIGVPALVVQRLCTSGFEAILQAAESLFAERGFAEARLEAVDATSRVPADPAHSTSEAPRQMANPDNAERGNSGSLRDAASATGWGARWKGTPSTMVTEVDAGSPSEPSARSALDISEAKEARSPRRLGRDSNSALARYLPPGCELVERPRPRVIVSTVVTGGAAAAIASSTTRSAPLPTESGVASTGRYPSASARTS